MARIDIRRTHCRTVKDARKAIDRLATSMANEFEMQCHWDGNVMAFSRSGIDGHIALENDEVHVVAELGFVMGMMKPVIEREINRHLDEQLS